LGAARPRAATDDQEHSSRIHACRTAFALFRERVPTTLLHDFEDISKILSEMAPLSTRGRLASRDSTLSHAQASTFADGDKTLQQITSRFADPSFAWFGELLASFKQFTPVLEETVTAADTISLVLHRLYRAAFVCSLICRCNIALESGHTAYVGNQQFLKHLFALS
jgi:hypothetical protein